MRIIKIARTTEDMLYTQMINGQGRVTRGNWKDWADMLENYGVADYDHNKVPTTIANSIAMLALEDYKRTGSHVEEHIWRLPQISEATKNKLATEFISNPCEELAEAFYTMASGGSLNRKPGDKTTQHLSEQLFEKIWFALPQLASKIKGQDLPYMEKSDEGANGYPEDNYFECLMGHMLHDPLCPQDILFEIATNPSKLANLPVNIDIVQQAVASNPNCPSKALETILAKGQVDFASMAAAENKNTPKPAVVAWFNKIQNTPKGKQYFKQHWEMVDAVNKAVAKAKPLINDSKKYQQEIENLAKRPRNIPEENDEDDESWKMGLL